MNFAMTRLVKMDFIIHAKVVKVRYIILSIKIIRLIEDSGIKIINKNIKPG